ncbi:MAG TPA: tRNA (adenosine(37)-N6)-threonylcarbamoyltransferase complex ATPase subunit type 1 TsaE [Terriglobales bacterium]|nr:tRNA (adenosine(37)-N6)-threonylcarbamoyltransferase complex ATPase subunit type 1 TsaE [Terriglobales bacterium]
MESRNLSNRAAILINSLDQMLREYTTNSPDETIAVGRELASLLTPPKLVVLTGDLGAGKTTLVKGIAQGFQAAAEEDVTSPTFTLIHEYRGPSATLYHIDLYRIDTSRELDTLALDDLMTDNSVLLIEWGEKFERLQKERDVEIVLERASNDRRKIRVLTDLTTFHKVSQSAIIPPLSKFKLVRGDENTPNWKSDIGRVFRVGYYSRQDGTDCIWLVNEKGEYEQTTDRDYLLKYFEPIEVSTETDLFGDSKPPLGPL